jgi:hypothetical protein
MANWLVRRGQLGEHVMLLAAGMRPLIVIAPWLRNSSALLDDMAIAARTGMADGSFGWLHIEQIGRPACTSWRTRSTKAAA